MAVPLDVADVDVYFIRFDRLSNDDGVWSEPETDSLASSATQTSYPNNNNNNFSSSGSSSLTCERLV